MAVKTFIKRSLQVGKTYEAAEIYTREIINHKTGELMMYLVTFKVPKLRTGLWYTVLVPVWALTENGLHLYVRADNRSYPVGLATGDTKDPEREIYYAERAEVSSFLNSGPVLVRSFWGTVEAVEMRLAIAIQSSTQMAEKSDYSALTEAFVDEITRRHARWDFVKVQLTKEIGLFVFRNEMVISTYKKVPAGSVVSIMDPDIFGKEMPMKNGVDTFVSCMIIVDGHDEYYVVPVRNLEFIQEG